MRRSYSEHFGVAGRYLCCDCDVVLTHEPCVMCAMALVHSRVRVVAFREVDSDFGGLGGAISLHQCPSLNHQFRVLRWEKFEPCGVCHYQTRRQGGLFVLSCRTLSGLLQSEMQCRV